MSVVSIGVLTFDYTLIGPKFQKIVIKSVQKFAEISYVDIAGMGQGRFPVAVASFRLDQPIPDAAGAIGMTETAVK